MAHYSDAAPGRQPRQWSGVLLGLGAGILLTLVGTRFLAGREATPPETAESAPVATQTVTVTTAELA
ncbi:MAG: efflux RND transporter periplasmic adaptor subunit, partial [Nodosilinea sp.]